MPHFWPHLFLAACSSTAAAPADYVARLDVFADADCVELPGSPKLLQLMTDMSDRVDAFVCAAELDTGEEAARALVDWVHQWGRTLMQLASELLDRPYCEPAKLAWIAAQCVIAAVLSASNIDAVASCTEDVEELLARMSPVEWAAVQTYETRFHRVLAAPWPTLRILDGLVRVHPTSEDEASELLGRCAAFENARGEPDVVDWPSFRRSFQGVMGELTRRPEIFELRPEDGPLSVQHHTRWLRVHAVPGYLQALELGDLAAARYVQQQHEAGCHLGVAAAYLLRLLLIYGRDSEGTFHRFLATTVKSLNILAPLTAAVHSDWPVFRALYFLGRLRRGPVPEPGRHFSRGDEGGVVLWLWDAVVSMLPAVSGTNGLVAITGAWGSLAPFVGVYADRWASLVPGGAPLLVLAFDEAAASYCHAACVDATGADPAVAKYVALAAAAWHGAATAWLELDVYVARNPAPALLAALGAHELVFARHLLSESLVPCVVAARGTRRAAELLLTFAEWLRENPHLLDHQGWDAFLGNRAGDFGSGYDYMGRNTTMVRDGGPRHSFLPPGAASSDGAGYGVLSEAVFGAGDGWRGSAEELALFHFWGARASQRQLFAAFYPHRGPGFSREALNVLARCHREPSAAAWAPPVRKFNPLQFVAVSYADGCCANALELNRQKALTHGAARAFAYSRADLDPAWLARNEALLSNRKGAGLWLWKPYVILKALRDDSVPWHHGVVVWVDAGNFLYANPRRLAESTLHASDVAAPRLKCCLEDEWTHPTSLRALDGMGYEIAQRPQLGAYFVLLRKTPKAIGFVLEWLMHAEERLKLWPEQQRSDPAEPPTYERHMADQSVFSVLFKRFGFQAMTLEEAHRVVKLRRWRE
eukprot:NODE_577_length_2915_cov_4.166069.p1 GENE.NODE_577_length_2915_cov_4.166069~~NODE_577_length_2915_cov_4.166069.p1  ORF type:complete len:875 (-),score=279.23 NODE_577_length_2915_cov_4.166069:181-2805(-)